AARAGAASMRNPFRTWKCWLRCMPRRNLGPCADEGRMPRTGEASSDFETGPEQTRLIGTQTAAFLPSRTRLKGQTFRPLQLAGPAREALARTHPSVRYNFVDSGH